MQCCKYASVADFVKNEILFLSHFFFHIFFYPTKNEVYAYALVRVIKRLSSLLSMLDAAFFREDIFSSNLCAPTCSCCEC